METRVRCEGKIGAHKDGQAMSHFIMLGTLSLVLAGGFPGRRTGTGDNAADLARFTATLSLQVQKDVCTGAAQNAQELQKAYDDGWSGYETDRGS